MYEICAFLPDFQEYPNRAVIDVNKLSNNDIVVTIDRKPKAAVTFVIGIYTANGN